MYSKVVYVQLSVQCRYISLINLNYWHEYKLFLCSFHIIIAFYCRKLLFLLVEWLTEMFSSQKRCFRVFVHILLLQRNLEWHHWHGSDFVIFYRISSSYEIYSKANKCRCLINFFPFAIKKQTFSSVLHHLTRPDHLTLFSILFVISFFLAINNKRQQHCSINFSSLMDYKCLTLVI